MNIVCWWSGGVTSAVACKKTLEIYGTHSCKVIFIDTKNEDPDTYRFLKDCENWYGVGIQSISNRKYATIQDVWHDFNSLNVANGAICSSSLKRQVRLDYQKKNDIDYQVFGFDIDEVSRAKNIKKNYPASNPIFPLLMFGLSKKDCIKELGEAGIEVPITYKYGFQNNNCFQTGCVQGGIGYWKKIEREFPEKFETMASLEHELTAAAGKPVTCLKDQSNEAKKSGVFQVFLKKHPQYPNKCLADMSGREPENLSECNGFCGTSANLLEQV